MTFSGSCLITLAGGRYEPQTVAFSFTDEQVQVLRGYLAEAERLERSVTANGGFPVSLNLSAAVGQPVSISGSEPTDDQRAIYLHRIRPFHLQDEPYQFGKVKNVLARGTASSDFMQMYLRRASDMFSGAAMQQQVRIAAGDAVLNSDALFTAWLNAVEYHRDETKMLALLKGKSLPDEAFSRRIFVLLLRAKVDAVLALGNIINRILASLECADMPDA